MNALFRIAGRPRTVTTVVLGLTLLAVLVAETIATASGGGGWPFVLTVAALLCALALLREWNRPLLAASGLALCAVAAVLSVAADLPSQPGYAASAALLVLGAASVRVATPRMAGVIVLAGTVVMVIGRIGERPQLIVPLILLSVMLWGGAIGLGMWLRSLDTHRDATVDAARRDERLQLARELHDVVAHHVTGIVIQAQAARIVAAKRPETLDHTLAGIESAGTDALAAMRRVIGLLRDGDDTDSIAPGPESLGDLVDRFSRDGPLVELRLPDDGGRPWSPEVTTTVYRVVQEALTNIVLHAPTTEMVTVTVEDDSHAVLVAVTDDAPSQQSPPSWLHHKGGYGLIGMRERVEAMGGSLHAGRRSGDAGWVVHAKVPLTAGGDR